MAICSLGEDGYMAESVENGGYPNGYNAIAEKYGFSKILQLMTSISLPHANKPLK